MRCVPRLRVTCVHAGLFLSFIGLSVGALAATRVHVIAYGKWTSVPWSADGGKDDDKPLMLKIRPLVIDGQVKEFVLGLPHEVTDRLFVVRRMFRVNDSLPEDSAPHWQWQRGGWLLVDRTTGRVSPINLPEFDAFYSAASWYRDYAAYCGISDDGKTTYAMVAQIGRRKPVLKKALPNSGPLDDTAPDSVCSAPLWQRAPARVSFKLQGNARETFAIRGHAVDMVNDADDSDDETK